MNMKPQKHSLSAFQASKGMKTIQSLLIPYQMLLQREAGHIPQAVGKGHEVSLYPRPYLKQLTTENRVDTLPPSICTRSYTPD